MAKVTILGSNLRVTFSPRERYLLGRPDMSIELARIVSAEIVAKPKAVEFGRRISKRPLLGAATGEYRSGSKKFLVLRSSSKYLKIVLRHPSIDEIWYGASDIQAILLEIQAKIAK